MNGKEGANSDGSGEAGARTRRALDYPFDIPAYSYILIGDREHRLCSFRANDIGASLVAMDGEELLIRDVVKRPQFSKIKIDDEFFPIIASGSNASPDQLARKFNREKQTTFIPVLRGQLHNGCSVYSAHFASYGSIAATTAKMEGAVSESYCTLLPKSLLNAMHATEALTLNYGFYRLSGMEFVGESGFRCSQAYAYLSLWGCLVAEQQMIRLSAFGYSGPAMTALDERGVVSLMQKKLGIRTPMESFILRLIEDDEYRLSITKRMSREFGRPSDYGGFDRVA